MKYAFLILMILLIGLLNAQSFDIQAFSDSTKYGWENYLDRRAYREDLTQRQDLLQLYEMEANSLRNCVIQSAIVPGWGQFTNKATTKGSVFLATELILGGAALYFLDRSNYYYDKYLGATQVEDIEKFYNSAVAPRQYSQIFIGAAAIVWVYNIFDVIQSTEEYNSKTWKRVEERHRGDRSLPLDSGLEVIY